jgi:hypothetical protein
MLIQIFYAAFFMYAWFDTDAFIEYSKLFGLSKRFRIDDWSDYREVNPKIGYLEYIRIKHSSFFIRLVTCKPCLLLWISAACSVIFTSLVFFPFVYVSSYLIYNLLCRSRKY